MDYILDEVHTCRGNGALPQTPPSRNGVLPQTPPSRDAEDLLRLPAQGSCVDSLLKVPVLTCLPSGQLFMDYICHVLYEMKFTEHAQVIDKDSIFVPIGWDSPAKMRVISEGKMSVISEGKLTQSICL